MSQIDNMPLRVSGEQRRHPAIRQLARACIVLARQQLEQRTTAIEQPADEKDTKPVASEEEVHDA